jgi:hypothetical protein
VLINKYKRERERERELERVVVGPLRCGKELKKKVVELV